MGVNARQCQAGSVIRTSAYQQSVHIPVSSSGFVVATISNPVSALSVGDSLTIANAIMPGVGIRVVQIDAADSDLKVGVRIRGKDHLGRKVFEDVLVETTGNEEEQTLHAWSRIDSVVVTQIDGTAGGSDSFQIGHTSAALMQIGVPAHVPAGAYTIFDASDGTVEATVATDTTLDTCRVSSTVAGKEFVFRFDVDNPDL